MQKIILLLLSFGFFSCTQTPVVSENSGEITNANYEDLKIEDVYKADEKIQRQPSQSIDNELKMPSDYSEGKLFSVIKEPSLLAALEKSGFSLGEQLGSSNYASHNAELLQNPMYSELATILKTDLEDVAADDLKVAFPRISRDAAIQQANKINHRVFDARWLSSKISNYELVGIVNRLDRVSFNPAHCGELRFIYRLSYDNQKIYSRLPMTVMVKYYVTHDPSQNYENELPQAESSQRWGQCKRFAQQWVYPKDLNFSAQPQKLLEWFTSARGPLSANLFQKGNFKSVEANLQALRIPSSIRSDLAGHGVYLMRVLKKQNGHLVPEKMENTPDVAKLNQQPQLKAQLLSFLKDPKNYHRLNAGILLLPDQFLAEKALSYSPFGIARKDNRLFEQVFSEEELHSLYRADNKYNYIRSPGAVARRLNDMSCVGCHQGSATAGFHFLGIDKPSTHQMNALIFEGSGHFESELKRRSKYLTRVLNNLIPNPARDFSIAPPQLAEETENVRAGYGHFCGLKGGGFERWVCADGLQCQQIDEAVGEKELGKCYPAVPQAGDPCFVTQVVQSPHQSDKLKVLQEKACGGDQRANYRCSNLALGHPAGTCYKPSCASGVNANLEICGYLAGTGFNGCMANVFAGKKTFVECAMQFRQQAVRGVCNESKSCRNDYVCVRAKDYEEGQKNGYCAPSYFLFQVRLDGHPQPQ
jgi:hypothetical protein